MEKYTAAFARQNQLIAESIQMANSSSNYDDRIKILESVIQEYPGHSSMTEVKATLEDLIRNRIKNMIAEAIRKARNASGYNEKFKILEAIIQKYPNHQSINDAKKLLQKYKEDRIKNVIAEAIRKARISSDYNEKYKILESIIQEYPDHKSAAEAKKLLKEFKTVYTQRTEELKKILAYCSQPKVIPAELKNQFGIDLFDVELLSNIKFKFRGIPDEKKLLDVLNRFQQIIARRIISEGYEKVKAATTYEEMFPILRDIIASCPEHTPELKAVRSMLQNTSKKYVELMIAKAQKSDNYDDAFQYLDNAIKYCPDASNIDDARNLHSRYRRELEQKRRAAQASQSSTVRCPACGGRGRVAQSGFMPGQASIGGVMTTCSTCSGSGVVRRSANSRQCPVCDGRGSRSDSFTNRPMQCSRCGGSGYVAD